MLVVTTTVGMVDGVHGNTTSLGPAVALGSELCFVSNEPHQFDQAKAYLVLGARRLHERLVCTATSSDDTDHTTA